MRRNTQNRKLKKRKNKNYSIFVVLFFVLIIIVIYSFQYYGYYVSKKDLQAKRFEMTNEERLEKELDAKLDFLSTKEGVKHIAKLNGFVEPGEIVIQLSEDPETFIIEAPKKNIFGKYKKLACKEHTINNKSQYNLDCVVCQKLNALFEEKQKLQNNKNIKSNITKKTQKINNNKKTISNSKDIKLKNHAKSE